MHGNLIRGLNVTGYTMFSNKGIKPRAAMLLSGVDAQPLAGRMHDDLVAITARLKIAGTVREVVIFLCSLPSLRTSLEDTEGIGISLGVLSGASWRPVP